MILTLHIENYALIRHSDIDFGSGFVAITGETGAGKSILLGALALLLGQRADSKVLFDPSRKCVVEASFNIKNLNLQQLFADNDVDYNDDGSLLLRREILPSAKSRAFANDTPVQLPFLRQLAESLIDIHSQHESLLLGDNHFLTSLLDSLAHNKPLLQQYLSSFVSYSALKHQLEELTRQEQQDRKDFDYNKFLFDELAAANLVADEQELLEQESSLLANAENVKQSISQIITACDGDEDSALSRLVTAKTLLAKISDVSPQITSLYERIDSSLIELRDILASLDETAENISFSQERQQFVDERLDLIYRLQRKHNVDSVSALLDIQNNLDNKLCLASSNEQRIHEAMEAVDKAFKTLQHLADQLTASRITAAQHLETSLAPTLADLGMANATVKTLISSSSSYNASGNNSIQLLFNANKGGTPRDVSKVASGGELSRLMLAIKALSANDALLPTVIFDEIDTGVSGDIALKVGRIMQRMSSSMQVIAITHLPQIAARANQHFRVFKDDTDGTTASNIQQLSDSERRHELAVMLSSDPPSQAALQTADELMSRE